MNLFKLSWSWYEDHSYYLFLHPDKTREGFEADVRNLYQSSVNGYLANERIWAGMSDLTAYVAERLPTLGYQRIEPVSFGCWGGYIVDNREEESSDELIKLIGSENWEKMIQHNQRVNQQQEKDVNDVIHDEGFQSELQHPG